MQSTVVCYATPEEAKGSLLGGGNGPITSGIPGHMILATYYVSRTGDATSGTFFISGDSCNDALYYTPDSWMPYMNAWQAGACSTAKHYTGANFTGQSVFSSGGFARLDPPFARNIRSIKFGA